MALWEYLLKKYGWNSTMIDSIWWQPYNGSITKLSALDKRRVKKFINNKIPTMHRNENYYGYKTSLCPCCKLYSETEDHIIRCRIPSRQQIHDKRHKEIAEYLLAVDTPLEVKYSICHGFFSWLENACPHNF
jgi:hypothetical protein